MRPRLFPLDRDYRCSFTIDYYDVMLIHTSKERMDGQHRGNVDGVVSSSERAPRAGTNKQNRLVKP